MIANARIVLVQLLITVQHVTLDMCWVISLVRHPAQQATQWIRFIRFVSWRVQDSSVDENMIKFNIIIILYVGAPSHTCPQSGWGFAVRSITFFHAVRLVITLFSSLGLSISCRILFRFQRVHHSGSSAWLWIPSTSLQTTFQGVRAYFPTRT